MAIKTKEKELAGFIPIEVDCYPNINNCLAFALGQLKSVPFTSEYYNLDDNLPIREAVVEKCKEFGIKARPIQEEPKMQNDEYVIYVFSDFFPFYSEEKRGVVKLRDFHVIRREPNGKLVHKPGWGKAPEVVTVKKLFAIKYEYPEEPEMFILKVGE